MLSLFKKNKIKLTKEQQKLDQIWSLWEEGQADSPYAELMTYQSEVGNGGHDQYFYNMENTGDLKKRNGSFEYDSADKVKKQFGQGI